MTIRTFWWNPLRQPRLLLDELSRNGGRWGRLFARAGHPISNFGDAFSPIALALATDRKVSWAHPKEAEYVGLGSILEFYVLCGGQGAEVWGAGLRGNEGGERIRDRLGPIHAVRGPLTCAALGEDPQETVLADPGVLISRVVTPLENPVEDGESRRIYVPHFGTWSSTEGRRSLKLARNGGVRVVAPTGDPVSIAKKLREACLVVTTSLHAVIFCHSLGVPVQLIELPGDREPEFKYLDYAQSIDWSPTRVPAEVLASRGDLSEIYSELAPSTSTLRTRAAQLGSRLEIAAQTVLAGHI